MDRILNDDMQVAAIPATENEVQALQDFMLASVGGGIADTIPV